MAGSVGQADFVMPKYSLEAVATIPLSNRSGFQEGSPWGAWRHNDQGNPAAATGLVYRKHVNRRSG